MYDKSKVTPRPWDVATEFTSDDYLHAIHCVNHHERLVEALNTVTTLALQRAVYGGLDPANIELRDAVDNARALLAAINGD